ncbi:MAG: bifunctional 4-hydroxy-3-methylbut-2-enyl diphosphate reductase/30S ribosomal protein S1 [Eubacteriales bacterium]|nr:bifunctional 4-hydroxy-3-methylbut-2-enyl diphosphate reductase/30S ribosomal protein S1 [Eubacteriales bacterium]
MRRIMVAPHAGFCFGVRQAVERALAVSSEGPVNTCGMLIHNGRVTAMLKERGIGMVHTPEEAPAGSTLIVRSHGEPKVFYEVAEARHLQLVDATCPFVARIHDIVQRADAAGRQVFIIGTKDHPEVAGTNGWCGGRAVIFATPEEAGAWLADHCSEVKEPALAVAQTTIRRDVFEQVSDRILAALPATEIIDTICSATRERQEAAAETAKQSDAMVVIGDRASSNTRKLYEIAGKYCKNTFFVENKDDLQLKRLLKYNKIGVAAGASTPEIAIKEVISDMSDNITENDVTMEDLMEDIEKSLKLPRSGELVTGKVHQVNDKEIIVNLGIKKDGTIPASEVSLEEGQTLTDMFHEGDEIKAKVVRTDDGDGTILLSQKKMEASAHWEEIKNAFEEKTLIDVDVVRQVNGGVIAKYKEVSGFIPLSQLSDRFVEDSSEFVGQTLTVKVTKVDERRNKAVFSHKAYLNEERQKALERVWSSINVGDIVEGTVMRFTDYGAFVDIGGIDGLLHISEISWGKLKHPKEALSIGQKISVKILSMNEEKGRISLGLKQTTPEPWSVIDENYHEGEIVQGKVVQIKEYGCFVELEPGLDGLVHISEVRHRRIANITDEVAIGDIVNAKILEIDKDRRRISLSIKETLDPEEEAAEYAAREAAKKAAEEKAEAEESAAEAEEAPAEESASAEEE